MLNVMIVVPTIIINNRDDNFLDTYADKGAARVPPTIRPPIICQWLVLNNIKKIIASVMVTKIQPD